MMDKSATTFMRRVRQTAVLFLLLAGPLSGCGPSKADEEALALVKQAYGERYEFKSASGDGQYLFFCARGGVTPTETEAREIYVMFQTMGGKLPDGRKNTYIFMHFHLSGGDFVFQVGPSAIIYDEVYY